MTRIDAIDYLQLTPPSRRAVDAFCLAHGHNPTHVRWIETSGNWVSFGLYLYTEDGRYLLPGENGEPATRVETVNLNTAWPTLDR